MSAATQAPSSGVGARGLHDAARFATGMLVLLGAMLLIAVVVAGANGIRVRVEQTGSMAPVLNPGDLVLVRQTPLRTVRTGDIVGVKDSSGRVIVHRVKRIEPIGSTLTVTTQGDANPTSEQWTLPASGNVTLVLARVPAVGDAVQALRGPLPALAVLLAAVLLAVAQLRSIWSRA